MTLMVNGEVGWSPNHHLCVPLTSFALHAELRCEVGLLINKFTASPQFSALYARMGSASPVVTVPGSYTLAPQGGSAWLDYVLKFSPNAYVIINTAFSYFRVQPPGLEAPHPLTFHDCRRRFSGRGMKIYVQRRTQHRYCITKVMEAATVLSYPLKR